MSRVALPHPLVYRSWGAESEYRSKVLRAHARSRWWISPHCRSSKKPFTSCRLKLAASSVVI